MNPMMLLNMLNGTGGTGLPGMMGGSPMNLGNMLGGQNGQGMDPLIALAMIMLFTGANSGKKTNSAKEMLLADILRQAQENE